MCSTMLALVLKVTKTDFFKKERNKQKKNHVTSQRPTAWRGKIQNRKTFTVIPLTPIKNFDTGDLQENPYPHTLGKEGMGISRVVPKRKRDCED